MDITDPPRMFLKYRKMIAYGIKFNFSIRILFFLRLQLVKDLTIIWVGGNFTLSALRLVEIFWLVEALH